MGEWQSIENAPKDGTRILACRLYDDGDFNITTTSWGICSAQQDGFVANSGKPWWRAYGEEKLIPTPTHWMPLPEPPS